MMLCVVVTVLTSTKKRVGRVFGKEWTKRKTKFFATAFLDDNRLNGKNNQTNMNRMMGWIENRSNKILSKNFVRQGPPAKSETRRFRFISLNYSF